MSGRTLNFFARWRVQSGLVPALADGDVPPPERLLQTIWQHQRLVRDRLRTLEGRPVRVLHPGFRNVEAGPDFHGAVLQFGDEPPRSGDVEVDVAAHGWQGHRHAGNPAYRASSFTSSGGPPPGNPKALRPCRWLTRWTRRWRS